MMYFEFKIKPILKLNNKLANCFGFIFANELFQKCSASVFSHCLHSRNSTVMSLCKTSFAQASAAKES